VSDGKWFEIESLNMCEFCECGEDVPQFEDLASAIKFPRSILAEQVRMHCLYCIGVFTELFLANKFIQWVSHLDTPMVCFCSSSHLSCS